MSITSLGMFCLQRFSSYYIIPHKLLIFLSCTFIYLGFMGVLFYHLLHCGSCFPARKFEARMCVGGIGVQDAR
jgi:hypothetical protein